MSFLFMAPLRNNPTEQAGMVTTAKVTDQQGNVTKIAVYVSQELIEDHGEPHNAEDIARHKFETGQLEEDETGRKIIVIRTSDVRR